MVNQMCLYCLVCAGVVCMWIDQWSEDLYWVALQVKHELSHGLATFPVFICHSCGYQITLITHIFAGFVWYLFMVNQMWSYCLLCRGIVFTLIEPRLEDLYWVAMQYIKWNFSCFGHFSYFYLPLIRLSDHTHNARPCRKKTSLCCIRLWLTRYVYIVFYVQGLFACGLNSGRNTCIGWRCKLNIGTYGLANFLVFSTHPTINSHS